MILGTDMDGVLCWNSLDKALFRPYKLHQYYAKCSATGYAERFWMYIITGRRIHYKKVTVDWLQENNVEYNTLVMFPNKVRKNNRSLARFKAEKINALGDFGFGKGEEVWGMVENIFKFNKKLNQYLISFKS
jgi:hypothetical protein